MVNSPNKEKISLATIKEAKISPVAIKGVKINLGVEVALPSGDSRVKESGVLG